MKAGDRVRIPKVIDGYPYFKVGDKATLWYQTVGGSWWADFDERDWGSRQQMVK